MPMPNVRKMYVPDDGYTMFDLDLDSADLRIVTWESNCQELKSMFAQGLKPYVEVAKEYYHDPSITKRHPSYPAFKKLCHGTNYLGQAKSLAGQAGLLVHETERIQKWYFGKFPEIPKWHARLRATFMATGTVQNAFGNKVTFYDRLDDNLLRKAVATIPQSTVALLINRIWLAIDSGLPDVVILIQVHDSLLGEYPTSDGPIHVGNILRVSRIVVPYPDPLIIPVGLKTSTDSWGDCE
jgi:DNA polymerase I-like protein with 3'-5' exonuclease and polymerase domains